MRAKMWGRIAERRLGRNTGLVVLAWLLVCAAGTPAAAQVSFVGDWTGRYHEDQPDRVPGVEPNDYSGLPVNEAARMYADGWDVERTTVLEHQCQPYTMPYLFHGPLQYRVSEERQPDSQELIAIKFYIGTYQQWRTIWMDGRPHPPEYAPHTFVGFSTGEFNGDMLTVNTTHIKAGFFRRSGIPNSDRATLVEHFIRHGNVLSHVTIATDPVYLTEPYIRSQEFVLMERNNTNWLYNCEYANEIPRPRHQVPMFLPGKNPWLTEIGSEVRRAPGGDSRRRGHDTARVRGGDSQRQGDQPCGSARARRAGAGGLARGRPADDRPGRGGAVGARAGQRPHDRRRRRQRRGAGGHRRRPGGGHRGWAPWPRRCWPRSAGSRTDPSAGW